MYPHTITIFNVFDGKYYKNVVNNVLYISEKILSNDGLGEKYSNVHRTFFSPKSLENYVNNKNYDNNDNKFTLKVNDIIVKGEIDEINSLNELQKGNYEYFLIKSISDYSDIPEYEMRNIEVTD